jgi:iron-sulfur cluster repair protein YtfE (RIC family)
MDKDKTESSDLAEAIYNFADDLNGLVSRENQILQGELSQVSMLVGDAIKTLVESFNSLNDQVAEQADIVQCIVAQVTDPQASDSGDRQVEQLARISELNQQINQNVASATRSLQFDDIVQQSVAHSHNRAEQMEQLFVGLYEKLSELKVAEPQDATLVAKYLEAMHEEITHCRVALEKANPVKQTSMGAGKAELF